MAAGVALAALTTAVSLTIGNPAMADSGRRGDFRAADQSTAIAGSYIVVLKNRSADLDTVRASGSKLTGLVGGTVRRTFNRSVRGFSARMSEAQAKRVAAQPEVAYVEQDRIVKASATQPYPPSWGLDRIDQPWLPLDNSYTYSSTATNAHAYVIDSGIRVTHQDFGGRASHGYDFIDGDAVADDCYGHGTHVAGTLGGSNHGVAKGVQLHAVRVLDCAGNGTLTSVVAGIDWVTANAVKPAVANMSLGGGASQIIDDAVSASIATGITYVVAAGNGFDDACYYSPARTTAAITVGATDSTDNRYLYSNYGSCVDLFAPGVAITSTYIAGNTSTIAMTGTSMAAPHVAGAAALALSADPTLTPQQVRDSLVTSAHTGTVMGAGTASPNKLLNLGPTAGTVIALRSLANLQVVTAGNGSSPLAADRTAAGVWEQFDVVDAGNGIVNLRAHSNGKYVTAESGGTSPLIANRVAPGDWERFQLISNSDGSVSIKAVVNGLYVTTGGGTAPLVAARTTIGAWERFEYANTPNVVVFAAVAVDYNWVTAENGGASPLVANRPSSAEPGQWEMFDMVEVGEGQIGLRARANSQFVTTGGGTAPLMANRGTVGDWERFTLITNADGTVSLRAKVNGLYVTDSGSATTPLAANRGSIGDWEKYFMLG